MGMKEVKAAAEHFIASGCTTLTAQQRMAKFALAAIPVIEAAEKLHDTVSHKARFRDKDRSVGLALVEIRTALAKLRES